MNNEQLDVLLSELCAINDQLDAGALTKGTAELQRLKAEQRRLVRLINAQLPHGQEVLAQSKVEIERNLIQPSNN